MADPGFELRKTITQAWIGNHSPAPHPLGESEPQTLWFCEMHSEMLKTWSPAGWPISFCSLFCKMRFQGENIVTVIATLYCFPLYMYSSQCFMPKQVVCMFIPHLKIDALNLVKPRESGQSIFTILIKCFKNNPIPRLFWIRCTATHGLDSLALAW